MSVGVLIVEGGLADQRDAATCVSADLTKRSRYPARSATPTTVRRSPRTWPAGKPRRDSCSGRRSTSSLGHTGRPMLFLEATVGGSTRPLLGRSLGQ